MLFLSEGNEVRALGFVGSAFLKSLLATLRWESVNLHNWDTWREGECRILAFWHGYQLLMPYIFSHQKATPESKPLSVLISQHRDGRIVADVVRRMGINSVAGSSSRGGKEAMFQLIELLKEQKSHIAITPDGPRGPAYKLAPGVIRIAQRSGAQIYPLCAYAEKNREFKSWDKMILPKPFSRAVMIAGDPIKIPAELSSEEFSTYQQKVEDALNKVSHEAVTHFSKSG